MTVTVAGVSQHVRHAGENHAPVCIAIAIPPPHPPLYLLTHAVSFLPLATRYTCYSDSVNTPRCSPYSTDTLTCTSAARTSTLIFVGLHLTGISGYGDGDANYGFGESSGLLRFQPQRVELEWTEL